MTIQQHLNALQSSGSSEHEALSPIGLASLRTWVDSRTDAFLNERDYVGRNEQRQTEGLRALLDSHDVPDRAIPVTDYLERLDQEVLPHCSRVASPRYLGHMTSPIPGFLPELGRLVQTLNQNVVKIETSLSMTFIERQVLGMMHNEIYGCDAAFYARHMQGSDKALGIFASGGTIANVTALWVARRRLGEVASGLRPVVIGSRLMHYSFDKAAALMGLDLRKLPVDDGNRLDMKALKAELDRCATEKIPVAALVAIGGSTDFGSVDPLTQMGQLAEEYGVHLHVDAAWGGGILLSPSNRHILAGIELADSVTIDGHKQLMLPLGCGMLFFRNPELSKLIMHHAPYAVRATSEDQGRFTLEGTRPASALYLHAALHLIGRAGYDEIFAASLGRARMMAAHIAKMPEFELTSVPEMNILTYRYLPEELRGRSHGPEANRLISKVNVTLQRLQRDKGDSFVSRTFRAMPGQGTEPVALLRAVLLNPRTTEDDILFVLHDQIEIARAMTPAEVVPT